MNGKFDKQIDKVLTIVFYTVVLLFLIGSMYYQGFMALKGMSEQNTINVVIHLGSAISILVAAIAFSKTYDNQN